MRVALTGTPGTGKTSAATALEQQGYMVVGLHKLAQENKCICGIDKKRDTQLVALDKLDKVIKEHFTMKKVVFFEGHIGHLLSSMHKVILLRCHPEELQRRLLGKKWTSEKMKENVDAEILDVILCEAVEVHSKNDIFEIDTTHLTIQEVAWSIRTIAENHFQPTKSYRIGRIDWSEEIIKEKSS